MELGDAASTSSSPLSVGLLAPFLISILARPLARMPPCIPSILPRQASVVREAREMLSLSLS